MKRTIYQWCILAVAMLAIVAGGLIACQAQKIVTPSSQHVTDATATAATTAKDVGAGVHTATTQTADLGAKIVTDGGKIKDATGPASSAPNPTAYRLADDVVDLGQGVVVVSQDLSGVEAKTTALQGQVTNITTAFNTYKAAQEAALAAKAKENAALAKKNKDLENRDKSRLLLIGEILIAAGVAVAVCSFVPYFAAFSSLLLMIGGGAAVTGLVLVTLSRFLVAIEWIIGGTLLAGFAAAVTIAIVYLVKHHWQITSLQTLVGNSPAPVGAAPPAPFKQRFEITISPVAA